jgi:2-C-methyl-D-erythritol 4-phosphate cytidylyltransferase
MNKILAIIPSAGTGERFAENMPKQYLDLDGKSVIEHSVQPFLDSNIISKIIIPIAPNDEYIKKQSFYGSSKIVLINGGRTRSESVLNGLNHPEAKDFNLVITHDAARPNVNEDDLSNLLNEITLSKADCSIFYLPIVDSIKKISKTIDQTEKKSDYYLVQTPQISDLVKLKSAIELLNEKDISIPDESFAMESLDLSVSKIKGRSSNIKITYQEDLDLLRQFSTRAGTGFDLHTYKDGNGILIGGYNLECNYEIEAHSDGDVLLHSIADSILGAAALGDIGMFFADTDMANKGLDSKKNYRILS